MSQQINLRPPARRQDSTAGWALAGLVGYIVILSVVVIRQSSQVTTLEANLAQSQAEATTLLARIERASRGGAATGQIAVLDQKLESLRARLATNEALIQKLQEGTIGLRGGHSGRLRALASVNEPGVWLDSIEIDDTGQQVSLAGNALGYREVVRYSAGANRAMQAFGVEFGSADMMNGAGADGTADSGALKFTLK